MSRKPQQGPLQGIRILDLSRLLPGPLATQMMADLGAEVIKIEDPKAPDYTRFFPPQKGSLSLHYLSINRSKKSITLDLKSETGINKFFELVKTADIVIDSFRPGVLQKMGLDYESAKKHNEKIIYVAVTGYGYNGPYQYKAGHDLNYIGYAGILGLTGDKDRPVIPACQTADVAGGSYPTIVACLSALWARERTGKGQFVDVAMTDCVMPLLSMQFGEALNANVQLRRGEPMLSGGMANYNVYKCKDDKWIALGSLEPKFWQGVCVMLGKPDWVPRMMPVPEMVEALKKDLQEIFLTKSRDEWVKEAEGHDICLSPILDLEEVEKDEHLNEREMFFETEHADYGKVKGVNQPFKFSETPAKPSWGAPLMGEDNDMLNE
ncbi:MAG: CoA transferase [Sphingobacteriales bacterium]|nr:CoA transferase [Sphingobacteriales bacterium]